MSITGSYRTVFGDQTGTDGREVTDTDLNSISINSTRRAWEVPGCSDLVAFDWSPGGRTYGAAFEGGSAAWVYGRKSGTFTVDGGLMISSATLTSQVKAGFVGCWNESGDVVPPPAYGAAKMLWAWCGSNDIQFTHTAASAGNTRWDLVCVEMAEADTAAVPRDWMDETTGEVTSTSSVVAQTITVTAAVTSGAQSTGTPTMPSIPTGKHVLYAVRVSDTAILEIWDMTIPIGSMKTGIVLATEGMADFVSDVYWSPIGATRPGAMASDISIVSSLYVPVPANIRGNPSARVLGARVSYLLQPGCLVYLERYYCNGNATSSVHLKDISASFTMNSAQHAATLDLRGYPHVTSVIPCWASGYPTKGSNDTFATLALRFVSSGSGNATVDSVAWTSVGG